METFMGKLEKKEDTRGSRVDAAQRLTRLAGIIAQGRADLLGREVVMGDEVDSCWSITVRDGVVRYELSLAIPVVEDVQPAGSVSEAVSAGERLPKKKKGKGRYQAKKIKKTSGALWKIIKKAVQEKRAVSESEQADIERNFAEYAPFVEEEWKEQWDKCADAVFESIGASRQGDFERAQALVKEANNIMKACHKKYK